MTKTHSTRRILFLLTQSLESPGGGGRFFPLAKALVNKGFQVTIIALHHDFANAKQKQFVKDGVMVRYVGQMHVRKTANGKTYFKPWKLLWITAVSTIQLTWAVLWTPSDIIQVCKTQPMNGIAARIGNILKRVPVFIDSDDLEGENNRFSNAWQQKIVMWFENWMPSFANGITVGNTYIAQHFITHGYNPDKVLILHNGVDQERFSILNNSSIEKQVQQKTESLELAHKKIIVYIGSMSLTSHAIDILLEAFIHVVQEIPQAHLLLVGSGEDLNSMKNHALKLGLQNNVSFLGSVPSKQIPLFFRLGEVSVDPMHDSIQAKSSLSLKLIESIVAEVPCITSDIGDRKEIVGKAGIAVIPNDATELAKGILLVLNNSELQEKMHKEAIKNAPIHYWDNKILALNNFYQENL